MALAPRAVVVTRPTELEQLLGRHGTLAQARFVLERRGLDPVEVEARHAAVREAVERVLAAIPLEWRRAAVGRADLDRFIFGPEDIVCAVGQDGLVANVAKYLDGQIVVGFNPGLYDGVLVPHAAGDARELLHAATEPEPDVEARTLVEARIDGGGGRLLALNEVFIGHRTHQSARYVIGLDGERERQSSSGLIVSTGTGATGWARSIAGERMDAPEMPAPTDGDLVFFVREAFPSVRTGTSITAGRIARGGVLKVTSEMNEDGTAFGDGIEADRLALGFGQTLTLRAADRQLRLLSA